MIIKTNFVRLTIPILDPDPDCEIPFEDTSEPVSVIANWLKQIDVMYVHAYYFPGDDYYCFIYVRDKEDYEKIVNLGRIEPLLKEYKTHRGCTILEEFQKKYPDFSFE